MTHFESSRLLTKYFSENDYLSLFLKLIWYKGEMMPIDNWRWLSTSFLFFCWHYQKLLLVCKIVNDHVTKLMSSSIIIIYKEAFQLYSTIRSRYRESAMLLLAIYAILYLRYCYS